MGHIDHKEHSPVSVVFGLVTVSDSRTEDTDESGRYTAGILKENGHTINCYHLLRNDASAITKILKELLNNTESQIIVFSGGTGLSQRDLTVETVAPMFEKQMPGFGELFRLLTWETIGSPSIMSRAVGGVIKGKVVLCLPGSLNAVKLAVEQIILPEAGHMVREATR
ncbi:MAG: MogA/MoaB family molybdenum cofactor biosynthesis protein [Dehalogenimonas sp.]